jgi:hypothetical protein
VGRESSAEFFEDFVTWWGNFANLKGGERAQEGKRKRGTCAFEYSSSAPW